MLIDIMDFTRSDGGRAADSLLARGLSARVVSQIGEVRTAL